MSAYTDTDCLIRGLRDAVAAEGFKRVDPIALVDLSCYVMQIIDGGTAGQLARVHVAELVAAGRAALEREAAR